MLDRIQPLLNNRLDPGAMTRRWIAGIIGDRPSQYAKSPSLWNQAFTTLGLDGVFLSFDVEAANLGAVAEVLRSSEQVVGFSVTVPYKIDVIRFLDDLDLKARQIGAVNTVARTADGRLVGCNTDGQGFIDMLTKSLPGQGSVFCQDLKGHNVLLIGAGGAARAVAFFLAEAIGDSGRLTVANRDLNRARELAEDVAKAYANAVHAPEDDIAGVAAEADVVVNATTKGQAGVRKLAGGRMTSLEPYCALAPASPAEFPADGFRSEPEFYAAWYKHSCPDIEANLVAANRILTTIPTETAFVDLIYAPLETRLLAMARLSGHRVLNGKGMNISQATDAFVNRVMRPHLAVLGWDPEDTYRRVFEIMARIW